jgi:hypothetical protein
MEFERRDFLRTATSGLALGLASCGQALAQNSAGAATGEFRSSSGTLLLEGRLKAGVLKMEVQDLLDRSDRAVIVRGKLNSTELYSAMFSYQKDLTVFALFHDNDHSTTVVLSDSDDAKIGRLVVWNDGDAPQISSFEKGKIMDVDYLKDIAPVSGNVPDFVGKRKPPAFTWRELENVFGSDPSLLAFMHGKKTNHHPREEDKVTEWICRLLSMVPGSLLPPIWAVR